MFPTQFHLSLVYIHRHDLVHSPPPTSFLLPPQINTAPSLVCNSEARLGRTGAFEIKKHPFFTGVDFDNLRRFRAPFEPRLTSEIDTTYFPTEELEQQAANAMDVDNQGTSHDSEHHDSPEMTLPFIGYTFKRFENNFR